jgi:hypothetical protein
MDIEEANALNYGQRVHIFAHMKREYKDGGIMWAKYEHEEPKKGTFFGMGYIFNGEFKKNRRRRSTFSHTASFEAACVIIDNGISAHIIDIIDMEAI